MSIQRTSKYITSDSYYDGDKSAPRTPWGPAQNVNDYANGLKDVTTSGHGGLRVCKSIQKKLPSIFRRTWFEEDCESYIVAYFFYDELHQVAMETKGTSYDNVGVLPYIRNTSKEEVFKAFFKWYGGEYDYYMKNEKRPFSYFIELYPFDLVRAQNCYERYTRAYEEMKLNATSKKKKTTLSDGMTVKFSNAFNFTFNGKKEAISLFKVIKDGRRVRFIPKEGAFKDAFHAQLTRWRKFDYEILAR